MRQCSAWVIYSPRSIHPQGGRVSMTTMVISILHVFPVEVWHCVAMVMQILFPQYSEYRSKTLNSVEWCLCPELLEVRTPCQGGTEESFIHGLCRSNGRSMVARLVSVLGAASGGLKPFTFTITGNQQPYERLPGSG